VLVELPVAVFALAGLVLEIDDSFYFPPTGPRYAWEYNKSIGGGMPLPSMKHVVLS